MATQTPPGGQHGGQSEVHARVSAAAVPDNRKIAAPRVMPEVAAFWEAAQAGRYLVKRCQSCGEVHHYPRDICPFCLSDDTVWQDSEGLGEVYSFSTMGQGPAAYTLAYITLDEGVTVMSNLVDCDPSTLQIGQRVRVVFKPADNGQAVPMFAPVAGGAEVTEVTEVAEVVVGANRDASRQGGQA